MTEAEYERYSTLAEVAELYYLKGKQQAEIAGMMNISRSLVSRMISEAHEKGIVSITINHFFRRNEGLEHDICRRYNIDTAVMAFPHNLGDYELKKQVGKFAAGVIYDKVSPSSVAGFTFGTTLKEVVGALADLPAKNITAVQLTGSLGASESAFDSHDLVHLLFSAWNCGAVFLHAPLIVNNEEMKSLLFSSKSNSLNAETCRELDMAVVGLSSFSNGSSSALYTGGHISAEDLTIMRQKGIIGDVGSYSLNEKGELVDVESMTRMIAPGEAEWKSVKDRIGVAFGRNKVDIIRAALRGGWLSMFITDEQTAKLI